jgi:hypothetical protein
MGRQAQADADHSSYLSTSSAHRDYLADGCCTDSTDGSAVCAERAHVNLDSHANAHANAASHPADRDAECIAYTRSHMDAFAHGDRETGKG